MFSLVPLLPVRMPSPGVEIHAPIGACCRSSSRVQGSPSVPVVRIADEPGGLPPGFTDPLLCAFANAILHCSTCGEVAIVLSEAIVRADEKIISDFAAFLMTTTTRADCFYDVNVLPYPKEAIIAAIEREIVRSPLEAQVDCLQTGAIFLWNFLEGVGAAPLPLTGSDLSQLRGATPADLSELRQVITSPEYSRDVERAETFNAIADKENKQIEERIAAAVHARSTQVAAATFRRLAGR